MYNIGICDDGKNVCSSLEKMILQYSEKKNIPVEIKVWYTGEGLFDYLKERQQIDILFLDIELFRMTGIEAGDYIRNRLEDRSMQIIYISGKSSYARELFKTQPMDFLVKPITQQDIDEALELAIKIIKKNMEKFEFQIGHDFYYMPYGSLLYFSSEGRKIKIFTTHGEQEFYGKLRDVSKKLSDSFLNIHHSYIVNPEYVLHYAYDALELMDGTILPISKANRKQIRERILRER